MILQKTHTGLLKVIDLDTTYVFSHEPNLTAEPTERLERSIDIQEDGAINEQAIYKLENGKFAILSFRGTVKDLNCGTTEVLEFFRLDNAKEFYQVFFEEE